MKLSGCKVFEEDKPSNSKNKALKQKKASWKARNFIPKLMERTSKDKKSIQKSEQRFLEFSLPFAKAQYFST